MDNTKTIEVNKNNFEQVVLKSEKPVVVDFWAAWCGPCRTLSEIIEQLAEDFAETVVVAKVNVDDETELSTEHRIMSIPTIMIYKNGQIVEKMVGVHSSEEFSEIIKRHI